MAGGVLLHAPADLIDALGAERDDVEGVQDGGGGDELVVDRALVALERVEGGDVDTCGELLAAGLEPVGVGGRPSCGPGPGRADVP